MNCHFLFITQTCKTQMIKQFKWRYSFSILTYSMQTKSCFVYSAQWCFSKWARLILAVMISLGSAQAEQLALKAMRILNKFMHCCCLLSICFFKKKNPCTINGSVFGKKNKHFKGMEKIQDLRRLIMEWGERVALALESTQTMLRSAVAQIQMQLFEVTVRNV